jgi:hypothetical protein
MNKIFTLNRICMLSLVAVWASTSNLDAQIKTYQLDINSGSFMGSPIPDYTKWYYFSFEKGDTIGSSEAVLINVNPGQQGTEEINADWKARTDWDIAFHATDIRTNSGASGSGEGGSRLPVIAEGDNRPLDEIFRTLAEAPADGYAADEELEGTFIFAMTSMPPLRTARLSASAAAAGWAAVAMGGNEENPRILLIKTATGKYAKVHLKSFFGEDDAPGKIVFDYFYQADGSRNLSTPSYTLPVQSTALSIFASEEGLQIEGEGSLEATVYNLTGMAVKQLKGQASLNVSGLAKGIYIVRVNAASGRLTQKVFVK